MKIGQLAKQTGCKVETIRYYEHMGLVPAPPRTDSGYRIYSDDYIKRLRFIKRTREMGFTLEHVKELLALDDGNIAKPQELSRTLAFYKNLTQKKIKNLKRFEKALSTIESQGDTHVLLDIFK